MAKGAGNHLIVVSILEGRYFPYHPDRKLMVEAKFDGEVMCTDPVPHAGAPNFNTELAWEVDRKGLTLHRLQRTPIKLQCMAVQSSGQRESVGYLILDLRLARESVHDPKWYPLLNSKYQKERPEMFVGIHLEKEAEGEREESSSPIDPQLPAPLKPQLHTTGGFYDIGPTSALKSASWFSFSVTLTSAENLDKLPLPPGLDSASGFCLLYSLLGNEVGTEPFTDLFSPSFPLERASVKIHTTPDLLRSYFASAPPLEVVLSGGEDVISTALVDLSPLAASLPVLLEANYQFSHSPKAPILLSKDDILGGAEPYVGVSLSLKQLEEVPEESVVISCRTSSTSVLGGSAADGPTSEPLTSTRSGPAPRPSVRRRLDYSHSPPQKIDKSGRLQEGSPRNRPAGSTHLPAPPPEEVPAGGPHHYCFTLELRTLSAGAHFPSTGLHCYLRYSYPFFGTTATITTSPAAEVGPNFEIALPNGYCAFNFASSPQQVAKSFKNIPLVVELVHQSGSSSHQKDGLLGACRINLSACLDATPHPVTTEAGSPATRKFAKLSVALFSPAGTKRLGRLNVAMTLDDLGAVALNQLLEQAPSHIEMGEEMEGGERLTVSEPLTVGGRRHRCCHSPDDHLVQSAIELEVWKERQQEIFRKQLAERETSHCQALTEEWKKRDSEREVCFQNKMKECQQLESTLKKALSDLKAREAQLDAREAEVCRRHQETSRQASQMKATTKDSLDRMKAEHDYLLELERKRTNDAQLESSSLRRKVEELEKRVKDQELQIQKLQRQCDHSLESLRPKDIENKALCMEKVELAKKLAACCESRLRYKQQWIAALREVNALHSSLTRMQTCTVVERERRAEDLRLGELSAQQLNLAQQDREDLAALRDRVAKFTLEEEEEEEEDELAFRTPMEIPPTSTCSSQSIEHHPPPRSPTPTPAGVAEPSAAAEQLHRMIKERDTLLKTGVYTEKDHIIAELNRCIDRAQTALCAGVTDQE